MKTTLNIDDTVMKRLREEAARRGTTMSALVEAGLRRVLEGEADEALLRGKLPEHPAWSSGGARIDLSNREDLYSAMDGD